MKAQKRAAVPFALSLILALPLSGQAENLLDAYNLAAASDPRLRAAEAGYLAAQQAKPLARSARRPQVAANAGYSFNAQDISDSPTYGSYDDTFGRINYGIGVNQSLYNKSLKIQQQQANTGISRAEVGIRATRQQQIVNVAEAYFSVLAAQESVAFAQAEKEAISRQLEQSRERFDVGMIAITDVREAEAQHDLSIAAGIAATNQLDIAKENLRIIVGQPLETLSQLQPNFQPGMPDPSNIDAWVELALENSLALQAADWDLENADLNVALAKSSNLPTLGASATYGAQIDDGGTSEANAASAALGLSFNWPLYQGGSVSARNTQAQHVYTQTRELVELQRRETTRQVRAAYLNVVAGISQVSALKQALTSTQTAHETAQAGFDVGTRTAVDVLLALRETYRAQRDYASARYNYILGLFRLKQAAGTLTASDIKDINNWL